MELKTSDFNWIGIKVSDEKIESNWNLYIYIFYFVGIGCEVELIKWNWPQVCLPVTSMSHVSSAVLSSGLPFRVQVRGGFTSTLLARQVSLRLSPSTTVTVLPTMAFTSSSISNFNEIGSRDSPSVCVGRRKMEIQKCLSYASWEGLTMQWNLS